MCPTARWRAPIGQSGILNSFLAILATEGVSQALMVHVLRLIGNSCADTGEMLRQLSDPVLTSLEMKTEKEWLIKAQYWQSSAF